MFIPKVSVVVPVYKAEKYLHICLKSLLNQTLSDFEILLVDDGSPDSSGLICDEYARLDSRIRVFHKINGGVSSARQCGVDNAIGEYIIQVDPDDWVEPNMLEELYTKAIEDNSDMVICDYYVEYENIDKHVYVKYQPSSLDHNVVLKDLFQKLHGTCCNKLVRHSCYKKYNIKYPLGISLGEDEYENASLLMHDIKISYLPKAYYHYIKTINENSLTKVYTKASYEQDIKRLKLYEEMFESHPVYEICKKNISLSIVHRAFHGRVFSSNEFKVLMFNRGKDIITNPKISIIYRLVLYLSCIGCYDTSYKVFVCLLSIKKKIRRLFNV